MSSTERRTSAPKRTSGAEGNVTRRRASRATRSGAALESPFAPTHEQIERRAYEIFLDSGAQPGHELEHWLQAERELARRL